MKTSYGELSVDSLDFTDAEIRIGNRSDALALLDGMIGADVINPDIALQALRDAIAREVI